MVASKHIKGQFYMLKKIKCLVCRVLFKLGLIGACKAPPIPAKVLELPTKKVAAKKTKKSKKTD